MSHEERYKLFGVVCGLKAIIEYTEDGLLKQSLIRCYRELCEAIDRPDCITELKERLEKLGQSAAEE